MSEQNSNNTPQVDLDNDDIDSNPLAILAALTATEPPVDTPLEAAVATGVAKFVDTLVLPAHVVQGIARRPIPDEERARFDEAPEEFQSHLDETDRLIRRALNTAIVEHVNTLFDTSANLRLLFGDGDDILSKLVAAEIFAYVFEFSMGTALEFVSIETEKIG